MRERIMVRTDARETMIDITDRVSAVVSAAGVAEGVVVLFSLHTTCALTVNEGYDPDVVRDMTGFMRRLVPQDPAFRHDEGNSDSHIKVSMFGPSLTLVIEDGALLLGRWQRIFLCEFDGPRDREIAVMTLGTG
jgi:secondary thiamine-phosphate synthase enzyme